MDTKKLTVVFAGIFAILVLSIFLSGCIQAPQNQQNNLQPKQKITGLSLSYSSKITSNITKPLPVNISLDSKMELSKYGDDRKYFISFSMPILNNEMKMKIIYYKINGKKVYYMETGDKNNTIKMNAYLSPEDQSLNSMMDNVGTAESMFDVKKRLEEEDFNINIDKKFEEEIEGIPSECISFSGSAEEIGSILGSNTGDMEGEGTAVLCYAKDEGFLTKYDYNITMSGETDGEITNSTILTKKETFEDNKIYPEHQAGLFIKTEKEKGKIIYNLILLRDGKAKVTIYGIKYDKTEDKVGEKELEGKFGDIFNFDMNMENYSYIKVCDEQNKCTEYAINPFLVK